MIGTGVAGMTTALTAARAGRSVLMVNKSGLEDSNTQRAKGGIAAVLDAADSIESHVADTLTAGDGLCDEPVVREIVGHGSDAIEFLQANSAVFDGGGVPDLGREGGHSGHRIVHAGGDATGAEVSRSMLAACREQATLRAYDHTFVLDLLVDDDRCYGALVQRQGELHVVWAQTVVMASGGAGRLYRESSNPKVATADGHAMAIRAGVVMRDMELVQFHPTLLYVAGLARTLITEAIRGHGAYLRTTDGTRFMLDVHEMGELAPRDVVARAINREMRQSGDPAVFLDVTHLDQSELQRRFPTFIECCEVAGIDPSQSWVPVRPGPHYMIGGIKADTHGRTSLDGLLAVGEASSTGLHGANRLASNSLLEGVVCGRNAGNLASERGAFRAPKVRIDFDRRVSDHALIDLEDIQNSVRGGMWRRMGVERDAGGMQGLLSQLEGWQRLVAREERSTSHDWEIENMMTVAVAMIRSALLREESRGVHYRTDFPNSVPEMAFKRTEYTQGHATLE